MIMKFPPPTVLSTVLCAALLLSACGDKPETNTLADTKLPANAPAIGTDIKDIIKPAAKSTESTAEKTAKSTAESTVTSAADANAEPGSATESAAQSTATANKSAAEPTAASTGITKIMWEDLIPADFRPEAIMAKYQEQIQQLEEGSPEEIELFGKLQKEFNSAPANESLAGKTVRIPGFVSPLDENNGMVGEFLLVPYFGACIHSPPPPINQTVLVKPQEGKSISMQDIYEPVWVIGEIKVEPVTTDLAQAGYQIENARLEAYVPEIDNLAN